MRRRNQVNEFGGQADYDLTPDTRYVLFGEFDISFIKWLVRDLPKKSRVSKCRFAIGNNRPTCRRLGECNLSLLRHIKLLFYCRATAFLIIVVGRYRPPAVKEFCRF